MKSTPTVASVLKAFQSSFLCLVLISFSMSAFAEYYIVGVGGCGARNGCYKKRVVKRVVKRRCCRRPSPIISVYYMTPACPCNGCVAPTGCGVSGWYPTPWETYNFSLFYAEPTVYYRTPNPDMATGDDDAFVYPDMNIDG